VGRQKRQKVDYFPHHCKHGKLLFILENEFGNDGYAFFYKLYEILGDEDGHVFRAGNPEAWGYLLAIARVTTETAEKILEKLCSLGVIDGDLWTSERTIWSQPLVDSLAEVYRKRVISAPEKPQAGTYPRREYSQGGISGGSYPQSKVKESKGKERSGAEISAPEKTNPAPTEKPEKKKLLQEMATIIGAIREKYPDHNYHRQVQLFIESNIVRANHQAITHCLNRLLNSEVRIDKPKPFLEGALWGDGSDKNGGENAKYNARDADEKCQGQKRGCATIGDLTAGLRTALAGQVKGMDA
jgi:hypothetical protein